VPEGDGVGLLTLDQDGHPPGAPSPEHALGRADERLRDATAPGLWIHREAVDPATPAVPAADHASHDDAVAVGDEENVASLSPHEPRQRTDRGRHARGR